MTGEPKLHYTVSLAHVAPHRMRVVWSNANDEPFRPYELNPGDLDFAAGEIRNELGKLVANRQERDVLTTSGDEAGLVRNAGRQATILRDLAKAGNRLFDVLTTPSDGSPDRIAYIREKILADVCRQPGPLPIYFFVPENVSIPWGLMCEGGDFAAVRASEQVSPDVFWCQKHRIATVFNPLVSPRDLTATYPGGEYSLLWGAHGPEFEALSDALANFPEEKLLLELIKRQFGDPVKSSDELRTKWGQQEKKLGMFYHIGHSDVRTISFSALDEMNVTDFKLMALKSPSAVLCFSFLNGCFTSGMNPMGTFLEAFGRSGFAGYVGVETAVPSLFAFRFGLAFKLLLRQGIEVVEALAQLQRTHWPLGLVYGLYGFPHIRVEPETTVFTDFAGVPGVNFADGPLTVPKAAGAS